MQLGEILKQKINSKPDIIQFAKDRKYEEAWIIAFESGKPSKQEISTYLAKEQYELLIVEYIWNSSLDDQRFVLTVFLDNSCKLKKHDRLIDKCLDLFFNYQNFSDFIRLFDLEIIGHDYLFLQTPETCNMSIFNYWLSVGPVELWSEGEVFDSKIIKQKISARSELERSKLNYQGLLFRFNVSGKINGPIYGLKTPCCQKVGDEWQVNYNLVDEWMRNIINL